MIAKSTLCLASTLLLATLGCGGSGGGRSDSGVNLARSEATVALGDAGYADLASLWITIHAMSLSGPDSTGVLVAEDVDEPIVIDALAYQGTAAPLPGVQLPAGSYDEMSFKLSISAQDADGNPVRVFPIYDPEGSEYSEIETSFALNEMNAFTVSEPAEDNQPLLFLHIDVESSIEAGAFSDSVTIAPALFLSTRVAMSIQGEVSAIDAKRGFFAVEDAEGATFVVQPTDCTTTILGFDAGTAGVSSDVIFDNIAVGDRLSMDGVLGIDPGCDDADQRASFFHPRKIKGELMLDGMVAIEGIVSGVTVAGAQQNVELLVLSSTHLGRTNGGDPGPANEGDSFEADFASTILMAPHGELHDLTGSADRLQIGEIMTVAVADLLAGDPGAFSGTARLAFLRPGFLSGMLTSVEADALVIDADGIKKGSGADWPARAFDEYRVGAPSVELGGDTTVLTSSASRVLVGPLDGWRLTQVLDPDYDNQLRGPEGPDSQNMGGSCQAEEDTDIDIDAGGLRAFVNHATNGDDDWTVDRLLVSLSSDATQKYVAWYPGTPACSLPDNDSWMNNDCIADEAKHRERIVLGSGGDWVNYGQSGAGNFGTSILNAGARVPDAVLPDDSTVAGWDDVNQLLLLGIDFDSDMYPFDDAADSCVGISERVWVDLSQAQFMYFSIDDETDAVDFRYLTTYADFKATVIALQEASGGSCEAGFHQNAGFAFTGLLDKESFVLGAGETEIVPIIRCISGKVFDGGCVAD